MFTFLKWLVITSVIIVFYSVLEYQFKTFTSLAELDPTCICYGIWGMLAVVMCSALYNAGTKKIEHLTILAFIVSSLGLLGTFWGMKEAFDAVDISSLDPANPEAVREGMALLFYNMYIAMNTTITGLFVSIPTMVYLYYLGEEK